MSILLPLWLAVCALFDLRTREVPGWLTHVPLALALIYAVIAGNLAAALLVFMILFSENVPLRGRGFYIGAQGFLAFFAFRESGLDGFLLAVCLLGIWLAWKLGAYGGADAQVLMALVLLLGLPVLLPVAVASGLQGMVALTRRQSNIPAMFGFCAGVCAFFLAH